MAMEDKTKRSDNAHNVILENRERLSVSGVEDVESFDEGEILMYTTGGTLVVKGENLRIEVLSLDSGELEINGTIDALEYQQEVNRSGGFWSRVFG